MFYYEQFFRTALDGIDRSNIMAITVEVAQVILLISFLVAVYESFIRGGDVRMLGIAAVKYVGLGLVLLVYAAAFRDVNAMFNVFADFIANNTTSGTDIFKVWMSDLRIFFNQYGYKRIWDLIMGGIVGLLDTPFIIVSYVVYPLTYVAFCFFYSFYGAILYVVGPIVLSLLPAFGLGALARNYIINLMTFHFWWRHLLDFGRTYHCGEYWNGSTSPYDWGLHGWIPRARRIVTVGTRIHLLFPFTGCYSISCRSHYSR